MVEEKNQLYQDIRDIRKDVKELLQRVSRIEGKAAMISTFVSIGISILFGFFQWKK